MAKKGEVKEDKKKVAKPRASTKRAAKKEGGKKKKDPNAPKRAKSAYFIFCEDKRPEIKSKYPDLKMTDVSKKLGEAWKELTANDKKVLAFFS